MNSILNIFSLLFVGEEIPVRRYKLFCVLYSCSCRYSGSSTLFTACLNGNTVVHLHMKCVLLQFHFNKNKIMSTYSTKSLVYRIL
jgi:hypothetical protein